MSEQKTVDINLVELVGLAANILHKTLGISPKSQSKPLFKELKNGKTISLGSLKHAEELNLTLKLELDYSEFCGPGFNFDIFKSALNAMLSRLSSHLQHKKDLNIMSSETGTSLIHVPGIIQVNHQVNVLVMAFDTANKDQITLKLMFIDPEQYKDLKA